jgi:hypothetical protein
MEWDGAMMTRTAPSRLPLFLGAVSEMNGYFKAILGAAAVAILLSKVGGSSSPPTPTSTQTEESRPSPTNLTERWINEYRSNRGTMISAIGAVVGPMRNICLPFDQDITKKATIFASGMGYKFNSDAELLSFLREVKARSIEQLRGMDEHPEIRDGICSYAKGVNGMIDGVYDGMKKDHPEDVKGLDNRRDYESQCEL